MTKLFLFDFDGTLVSRDILDVVCEIVGKKEESFKINQEVKNGNLKGLEPLCKRINFLKGVSINQIKNKLDENNYLQKGAKELFDILREKGFITILSSGNITPVLEYYKTLLNISYVFGTNPQMDGDKIEKITIDDFTGNDFKYNSCLEIIKNLNIKKEDIYGIGDSIVDLKMLSLAGHKFAINPTGGLEKEVDVVIKNDLREIEKYL